MFKEESIWIKNKNNILEILIKDRFEISLFY